jgi:hypothetical protein|tara:strand:- start:591 stop:908 length:318 start_codon:yes stop_codon:yes gene_type:complete
MIGTKNKQTLTAQLVIRGVIFGLFFLGLIIAVPSFLIYILILAIIANLILGFTNGRKSILTNVSMFIIALLLFVFLIEYVATLIGLIISFIHLLFFIHEFRGQIF